MKCTLLLVVTYCVVLTTAFERRPLKEIFAWKYFDFQLSNKIRNIALASGSWIPANNVPMAFTIWQDKLFLPIFRWKLGVVSALNYINISSSRYEKSPVLIPYPSIEANYVNEDPAELTVKLPSNASVISSAYACADMCDRLWVLDSGLVDYTGKTRHLAKPSIVIFDLNTDRLIRRFPLPDQLLKTESLLVNIQVDVEKNYCHDAYAYATDLLGLIVYSFRQNKAWRVHHNFLSYDPMLGNIFVNGDNVQARDGVFSIAISNRQLNGARKIYFHPLSSTKEFYVINSVLKSEMYINAAKFYYDFHLVGDRGKLTQSSRSFFDTKTDVVFYPLVQQSAIGCWNTKMPMKPSSLDKIYENKRDMILPYDVLVDKKHNLWALSNSLTVFLYGNFSNKTYNFRIYRGSVKLALKGTNCY